MLAVVLCGGQSSRMGTDKGLLQPQGIYWARAAAEKMAALEFPVVLSVNEEQFTAYSTIFPAHLLIKDNKTLELKGPLLGVLSVHLAYPSEDLFVLACDMPLMDISILKLLTGAYMGQKADAWVFANEGEYEPLCAIYSARGLSGIIALWQTNKLGRHSMKYTLENMDTMKIPLMEEQKKYFRNFNTHAELGDL